MARSAVDPCESIGWMLRPAQLRFSLKEESLSGLKLGLAHRLRWANVCTNSQALGLLTVIIWAYGLF